jgi:hypothetical protein
VTTRLMEILDRDAAIMRAKMAEVMPAADGEAQQARELMILLHTGLSSSSGMRPALLKSCDSSPDRYSTGRGSSGSSSRNIPVSSSGPKSLRSCW